jgi:crossover junction endodeoxyribonuclease RuvC
MPRGMALSTVRIIGIDPGLRRTGWGMIVCEGTRISHIADGVLTSDQTRSLAERLVQLREQLAKVIAEWHPDEAAVEETFVNSDARATLKLGQARGIALLVPAEAGLPVAEYAPNQVKKTVVGTGHAEKDQIHHMVKLLLPRAQPQSPDAADALAIAICHAHHRGAQSLAKRLVRS